MPKKVIRQDGNRNIVGTKIRTLRTDKNMEQAELAKLLVKEGIKQADQKFVSLIELGNRGVYDYEIIAFAKALNVSCSDLLD